MIRALIPTLCAVFASGAAAQDVAQGLAAWQAIYATASHPRCSNCHIGESGTPGWAGLGFASPQRHGMAVQAGQSRIGAETIPCRACHMTSSAPNKVPHAPPHVLDAWRLPPSDMAFHEKSSATLCQQWRRAAKDMGRAELSAHLQTSPFVAWGFAPGAGRSPAPGSVQTLAAHFAVWGDAGMPCLADP